MPNGQPRIGLVSAAIVDLWPLRKNAAPACYFFQLLLLARMLIVDETSREASIRGSPNRRGLNSFPSSGSVGDLDRIGLPGGSIWIHNRHLRLQRSKPSSLFSVCA